MGMIICSNGSPSGQLQRPPAFLMAERVGFEPTMPFRTCRFSRPVPSTTRPPLRIQNARSHTAVHNEAAAANFGHPLIFMAALRLLVHPHTAGRDRHRNDRRSVAIVPFRTSAPATPVPAVRVTMLLIFGCKCRVLKEKASRTVVPTGPPRAVSAARLRAGRARRPAWIESIAAPVAAPLRGGSWQRPQPAARPSATTR